MGSRRQASSAPYQTITLLSGEANKKSTTIQAIPNLTLIVRTGLAKTDNKRPASTTSIKIQDTLPLKRQFEKEDHTIKGMNSKGKRHFYLEKPNCMLHKKDLPLH